MQAQPPRAPIVGRPAEGQPQGVMRSVTGPQPLSRLGFASAPWAYRYAPSFRNRIAAAALSLAICLGIALMLIWMGLVGAPPAEKRDKLTAISFSTEPSDKVAGNQAAAKAARPKAAAPVVPETEPQPSPQPRPTPTETPKFDLAKPRPADPLAGFDLAKLPKRSGGAASGEGQNSAAAYGPGEGPGGMRLYNAEWYREPTEAEVGPYMPKRNIEAEWAVIACRTVERYHVENCQELGESPRGSGLARALRQASWQFLVRPPRINGKPLVGEWVRIRFDFKRTTVKAGPAEAAEQGG